MGSARTKSFGIFHDPDAPDEAKPPTPEQVAEIEAAHEAPKQGQIDALARDFVLRDLELATEYRWYFDADGALHRRVYEDEEPPSESEVAKAKAQIEADFKKAMAGPEGEKWRKIAQEVQGCGTSKSAFALSTPSTFARRARTVGLRVRSRVPSTRSWSPSRTSQHLIRPAEHPRDDGQVQGREPLRLHRSPRSNP
ncbi:hypothetical protein ACFXAW_02925 [Streptomyces sp. NPDC059445]|uniref:hypothetical protein n=1 Tax=Streptomyces sp. NPDC059445 TaxID=3346832 RepID=UPI0036976396